jgi:hypothetical protein
VQVLVDGHNAIHRLGIRVGPHEAARRALLRRVASLAPGAVVFFDARGAPATAPGDAREEGVRVRYCRATEADQELVETVRAAAEPSRLLVVTDDLELARRVRQLRARTASVASFFREDEAKPSDPSAGVGPFRAADFGLPETIDLDDPDLA